MNTVLDGKLGERAGKVIEEGQQIAIIGWLGSNHNRFTRNLSEEKVLFFERLPASVPIRVGLVIFTRFNRHVGFDKFKRTGKLHPFPVSIGEIKKILKACPLLAEPKKPDIIVVKSTIEVPMVPKHEPPIVAASESPEQVFAKALLGMIGDNLETEWSIHEIGPFLKELALIDKTNPQKLVSLGWLKPITKPGKKKVGWYQLGERMLDMITKPEPSDPVSKLQRLIASEANVVAKRDRLLLEMDEVTQELSRIIEAKRILGEIEDLMK